MSCLRKLIVVNVKSSWKYGFFHSKRLLFCPTSLGIDSFIRKRQQVQTQMNFNVSLYKKRMKEICLEKNDALIFSNDILKMVYLAEDNEDLDIIHKLLNKYKSQNKIKITSFNIGPEVMRLHYLLNKPVEAMNLVKNLSMDSVVASSTTFVILLDLLFENNLYEDVIKMYHLKFSSTKTSFNSFLHLIYFAACYRLDTKESFEKAFKVWQDLLKIGYRPGVRIRLFFAALSLNQNQLFYAMEVLSVQKLLTVVENLKCIIFAKSKRFHDMLEKLREILASESNVVILQETICAIEKEIGSSDEEILSIFKDLKKDFIKNNKLMNESIDHHLCNNLKFSLTVPKSEQFIKQ